MQLIARVEKNSPPDVVDLCAAAGAAAVGLVEHSELHEPVWQEAIETWTATGRIRKLVRRARGAAWERAQAVAGVTAQEGTAMVRAIVPSPMDEVPSEIAKLQIRSSPLPPPELTTFLPDLGRHAMLVALNPGPAMSWGKQCAQAAHAAQLLWTRSTVDERESWRSAERRIVVAHPTVELWDQLADDEVVEVRDGGFTEVAPGTFTALARWS